MIETYMREDVRYLAAPRGPARVDALWAHARAIAGSNENALDLLGMLSVQEGVRLRHPFTTGLAADGMLEPNDKTDHFFAHAMWAYHDFDRLVPMAEFNGICWEIVGEIRSWFGWGVGFNWKDVWANRLGQEFGRRVRAARRDPTAELRPSNVLVIAERFRPPQVRDELPPAAAEALPSRPGGVTPTRSSPVSRCSDKCPASGTR
ncbi:MAG: hypothetical protein C4547_10680 [Phycisphaerales bacterium]|nr:MAG: hypothetical protein C4547_10680 [Phycisphaerales bacterium]